MVEGAIPPDLNGLSVRNGPNAWQGSTEHFFLVDGMLHGVRVPEEMILTGMITVTFTNLFPTDRLTMRHYAAAGFNVI